MKKQILIVMLGILSMSGEAIGQTWEMDAYYMRNLSSRTDRIFNSSDRTIAHRHSVLTENGAEIIFELNNVEDYNDIRNLDSIIKEANNKIQFYKDTLNTRDYDNVRIDYVVDGETNSNRMRYTTYPRTSEIFVSRKGEISRLKLTSDTVRIRIYRPRYLPAMENKDSIRYELMKAHKRSLPIQITLLLNNYTDIGELLSEYDVNQFVDSFYNLTKPKKRKDIKASESFMGEYHTLAHIRSSLKNNIERAGKKRGLTYSDNMNVRPWNFHGSVGASLVGNTVAPFAEIGIKRKWVWGDGVDHAFMAAYATPMFFFEKHTDGTYHTYDNWFVTLEYGARVDEEYLGVKVRGGAFGGSYLLNPNGAIFKNTTGKLHFSMHLREGITITPELIMTDNFKSIFPGLTVKIF